MEKIGGEFQKGTGSPEWTERPREAVPSPDPELASLVGEFFQKKGPAILDLFPPGSHLLYMEGVGFIRFQ